ncbi:hypothetical protein GDO86_017625 [Hymenochirus boettgeri]|uniref:Taste receptor type 2 n=1 Tax=Hymenochirus boettgeri TaxID=247094 RepID=A0A8T2ITB7_9PIPI|nr:hypothetical protein GDO86_017625 [Hymenochirus boettgeri]
MIVEFIIVLVPNLFMLSVNFHCWLKRGMLSSVDLIIVGLAFSSIIYGSVNCIITIILLFSPGMSSVTFIVSTCCSLFAFYSNAWLVTCLCFYFYVKIINFEHRFLSWLKMKIDTLVPWMILAAEVFSIFSSLLYTFTCIGVNIVNSTASYMTNQTPGYISNTFCDKGYEIINFYIPILIATVATGHIIVSLYKHTHRMGHNMGDGGGTSLEVHKRAARTLSSIVIYYIIIFGLELCFTFSQISKGYILEVFLNLLTPIFIFVQSVILILGNNRLLQKCVKILNTFKGKT